MQIFTIDIMKTYTWPTSPPTSFLSYHIQRALQPDLLSLKALLEFEQPDIFQLSSQPSTFTLYVIVPKYLHHLNNLIPRNYLIPFFPPPTQLATMSVLNYLGQWSGPELWQLPQ
jgi:hypothetical protein